jgi:hypothetical protein
MEMARPARSPLLGYNHNVKYGGQIFHVQTEDSGPGNPHLFTHLFFGGSILASKRGQYDPSIPEEEVRAMMQAQHKAILKELKQTAYDERIARFFSQRGESFPTQEFFTSAEESPSPLAVGEPLQQDINPVTPPPEVEVLDLDALPALPAERARTPEPLPVHFTRPSVPGPGTYALRRPSREVFAADPEPAPAKPRPAAGGRPVPARPATPVIVQRQIVVGAGAPATVSARKGSTTPVRRRPVSGGPYVVKEGSHVNIAGSGASRTAESPPRPLAPNADSANAPRTAESRREPQEASPSSFVTDQSLDDVILAYLSQGEGKR